MASLAEQTVYRRAERVVCVSASVADTYARLNTQIHPKYL